MKLDYVQVHFKIKSVEMPKQETNLENEPKCSKAKNRNPTFNSQRENMKYNRN